MATKRGPRTPGPRTRLRQRTGQTDAEQAIFATIERLLETESLYELSTARIITESGVSRASFWFYFKSKYEVVGALMEQVAASSWEISQRDLSEPWESPEDSLRGIFRTGMEIWQEHRTVLRAVVENAHAVPELSELWMGLVGRVATAVARQIDRERAAGRAPEGLPSDTLAAVLLCAIERMFHVGIAGIEPELADPDARLDTFVSIAMAVIYAPEPELAPA